MKYRKKPVVIDAIQWDGTASGASKIAEAFNVACAWHVGHTLEIPTLEGTMSASCGDYIIKGIKGECYPCKPDIFEMTYEPVTKDET